MIRTATSADDTVFTAMKGVAWLMLEAMLAPPYEETLIIPVEFNDESVERCQYHGACDGKQCRPCPRAIARYIDSIQQGEAG